MVEQIDDLGRVIQDLKKQSVVKSCSLLNSKDFEENYTMKLTNSQEEFSDLKISCTRMQTNVLLLECLAKDPKDWPRSEEVQEHIKQLKAERKQDKVAIKSQENEIESQAEEFQTKNKELKETLLSLEDKLQKVKNKKKEYDELKAKSAEMTEKMKEKKNSGEGLQDIEEKLSQSSYAVQQCTTTISSLEHCIKMLQDELDHYRSHVEEIKENLVNVEQKTKKGDEICEKVKWLKGVTCLLQTLSGMSVKEVSDDSLVLELHNRKSLNGVNNRQTTSLLLTLRFTLCAMRPHLCGAEVNIPSLQIEHLVKTAVQTNDIKQLVTSVKKHYQCYNALRDEIDELQKNYAVDWDPSLNHLRVMLGKSGKTVCTLRVESSYPAPDSLSMVNVESKDQTVSIDDLKAKSCNSLTEWVKHLNEICSSF